MSAVGHSHNIVYVVAMTTKRRTPAEAWNEFRASVEAQGGTVLEAAWKGVAKGHRVRCPEGHESTPQPQYIARGGGICSTCGYANRVSRPPAKVAIAEAAFRARVEELGGTVLEAAWKGNQEPHLVRCAEGHEAAVRPNNVTQGQGICLACTWSGQDVLYVVANPAEQAVKFGITSGDPAPRLRAHARDGFTEVVSVRRGLPQGRAHTAEQDVIRRLRSRGVQPVRGREYFPIIYTPFVLAVLDEYLR